MALNFGILDLDAPAKIAGSVYAGQQQRQQNELAQQQAAMRQQEMGMRQQEAVRQNELAQQQAEMRQQEFGLRQQEFGLRQQEVARLDEDRKLKLANAERRKQFLTNLSSQMEKGGHKLDRPTLGQMLQFGMETGEDSLIQLATKGMQALDEQEQFNTEMGRFAPKAAPVAPAVSGALGSGTFGITPAPVALPTPGVSPAVPSSIRQPPAVANALNVGGQSIDRNMLAQMAMSPNKAVRDRAASLGQLLPKESSQPASLVELQAYMAMTPDEKTAFEKLQKIKATNVTATATSTTPTAKSLAAPVGARAETSLVKAEGAIGMMENANAVREALNTGNVIAGPLAGARTKFAQVLELAGAGDKEKLIATRNTVQGLASLTLESRAELKGQGQITDTETKLLERARSADIGELTIPELQQVVNVSQRLANRMWSGHQNLLKTMETDPAAADSLKYYRPTGALPQALGEGKPKAEVDKRKAGLDQIFGGKK